MEWLQANYVMILAVLFGISEALSMIPALKSNGIFQAVFNGLKWAVGMFQPKKLP